MFVHSPRLRRRDVKGMAVVVVAEVGVAVLLVAALLEAAGRLAVWARSMVRHQSLSSVRFPRKVFVMDAYIE